MVRILIVDDEKHIRDLYQLELEEEGYEVFTDDGGQGILNRIEKDQPDLVVLDVRLDRYNGLELLREIKDRFTHLPMILCTGYDSFMKSGNPVAPDFIVTKSSNLSPLKETIVRALEANAPIRRASVH